MTEPTRDPRHLLNEIEDDHCYRQMRKKWHCPQFHRHRVADPGFRFVLNRYPHHIIGAGVVIGLNCWSVKWAAL